MKVVTLEGSLTSFNPRVREGRDKLSAESVRVREVSIHASARDATDTLFCEQ